MFLNIRFSITVLAWAATGTSFLPAQLVPPTSSPSHPYLSRAVVPTAQCHACSLTLYPAQAFCSLDLPAGLPWGALVSSGKGPMSAH